MLNLNEKTQHAMHDLAVRSRISSFFYLVIFSIVIGFTPFYSDHKSFITLIGVLLLVGSLMRGVTAWFFTKVYPDHPRLWIYINGTGVLVQAISWGLLTIMSIEYYGWQWTTMVIGLSAAAFAAGAVVTLSVSLPLIGMYLVCIFLPTFVVNVLNGTEESLIAAFLFMTYFVFLLVAAKGLHKEYWESFRINQLLKQRARELEVKNSELESFAYSVSHDLRGPLRSIDGFSQLVLEDAGDKLGDSEREYLQRTRLAAQKMGILIDDLLQLSNVSRAGCDPQAVDLSEMVESSFEKLRQLEPDRNVILDIEPNINVTGDQSLLDIAIGNLVDNAWKYTSKNSEAKIRFAKQERDGKVAYFIKDNGVGFDVRYESKLFGPFQRLHTDSEYPGTGIGLATVHRIIDKHGGRIWANAKEGFGATFYFTLGNGLKSKLEGNATSNRKQ